MRRPQVLPANRTAGTTQVPSDGTLREELLAIDSIGSDRFLEMGRRLRRFYEALPDNGYKARSINELLEGTKISRRSALYWIEIDRTYSRFNVPDDRLARIGWSKLSMMARHLTPRNVESWLLLAERSTANQLRASIRKAEPSRHYVVFKLSAADNAMLTSVLVANGARAVGKRRLIDKEIALIELCRRVAGTAHGQPRDAGIPSETDAVSPQVGH